MKPSKKTRRNYGGITNPQEHIKAHYGEGWHLAESRKLDQFVPLKTSMFPGNDHCSLTSLTAIFSYHERTKNFPLPSDMQTLFGIIQSIAKHKKFFHPKIGTIPFFIDDLARATWRYFGLDGSAQNRLMFYEKNSRQQRLVDDIRNGLPGVISFVSGTYKRHSVTYWGYQIFMRNNEVKVYLLINDNWSTRNVYVDMTSVGHPLTSLVEICSVWP